MGNHYHLLIETPKGNLSRRMGCLQNAFAHRINTSYRLWGHIFGGCYKSILVEPENCFGALLDHIHLNPVRADIVKEADGLVSYPWNILKHCFGAPGSRLEWMETQTGSQAFKKRLVKAADGTRRDRPASLFTQKNHRPKQDTQSGMK